MRRFSLLLLLVAQLVAVVGLLSCMRQATPPSPPPHSPAKAVDLWFSVENASSVSAALDAFGTTLCALAGRLGDFQVDYRISLFRSTENADGNYDARPQGPMPIVSGTDADPANELQANLAALRSAHLGSKPLPLEILTRAAALPGAVVDNSRHRLLVAIASHDATNYAYFANTNTNYAVAWNWYFGTGNWSTVPLIAPADANVYTTARYVIEQNNHLLPSRVFIVGGDVTDLAAALANWR